MPRNPGYRESFTQHIREELRKSGVRTTGNVYFVDSGSTYADDNGPGDRADKPMATIDACIAKCTASQGDVIVVMPGHAETVTAAITVDIAGISIIGLGQGTARPYISCATDSIDEMTITAANCLVQNLGFNESTGTTSRTSFINVAAANTIIRGCHFDCGQYDLEQITITADGDDCVIEDCTFVVTANGPDAGIEIEAAGTTRTTIRNNTFYCSDGTNAFDAAAINSTVANTGMVITGNTFLGRGAASTAIVAASAVDKSILSNYYGSDVENQDHDAFSGDLTVVAEPPPLVVDDEVWYVDSVNGNASFDGKTPKTALVTLAAAEAAAAAGDTIIVASGHTETLAAKLTINLAGLSIIGSGTGTRRPSLTGNVADDTITVTAANVTLSNLLFNEATSVTGGAVNVGAAFCRIVGCQFDLGANDLEAITVETAGDNLTVEDCDFKVTANGPDAAIEIEGTSSDLVVKGCRFDGGSDTNAWDAAAINSTTACTGVTIEDCDFRFCLTAQEYITLDAVTEPPIIRNCTFLRGAALASDLNPPQTFYVDSDKGNDAAGCGTSRQSPVATIDYAVGLCSANAGDTIIVAAGHAETISAAAGIDLDVAGITVIGEGNGTNRPTITMDTDTAVDVDIGAANVTIKNLRFVSGIDSLAALLDVDAGNFTCEGCDFISSSTNEVVNFVNLATTVDDFIFRNCYFYQPTDPAGTDDAANTGCFYMEDSENILIENCRIHGFFETSIFHNKTTAAKNLWIVDCYGAQLDTGVADVADILAGTTGGMVRCSWMVPAAADVAEASFLTIAASCTFGLHHTTFMNDGAGGNRAVEVAAAT